MVCASAEVEVDAGTEKFFCEHGYVEVVGVVSCEVASSEFVGQLWRKRLEVGRISHLLVGDACEFYHLRRNGLAWVHIVVSTLFCAVKVHLDIGYLYDVVLH